MFGVGMGWAELPLFSLPSPQDGDDISSRFACRKKMMFE
jgi:hypothetical protein